MNNFVGIGLFFVLQLINVILSTIRSITTVTASHKTAAIINAVSYTFYNGIVKLLTSQSMLVVLVATFITNIIGVSIANFILDKLKKDKLWVFNATIKKELYELKAIQKILDENEIKYIYNEIVPNSLYTMQIFSYTQSASTVIIKVMENFELKYYITESK